ncbi:winged helix-turn-helix transcriptional regulator [Methanococcoides sp. SA1]|nr:winged helix-turn-helix transcriptional regulator [Methanococcoides sp. SA1]
MEKRLPSVIRYLKRGIEMVTGFLYTLRQMFNGKLTLNELASESKMSKSQLNGMIEMMEKMGYIEIKEESCSPASSSCSGCCGKSCAVNRPNASKVKTKTFSLTEKGQKVCNSS